MTPEGRVKAYITKKLKELVKEGRAFYYMPPASRFGSNGTPDYIGCLDGLFFAIEAKGDDGKGIVSEKQKEKIEIIQTAKGIVEVISSKEEMDLFLKKYVK